MLKIFQFLCLGSIVLLVCRWQENLWIMTQKIVFFNSCVVHIVTIIVHIVLHNDNLYSWRPWSSKKHLNNNLFSYSEQRIDYKTFISIQRLLCVFCLRLVTVFFIPQHNISFMKIKCLFCCWILYQLYKVLLPELHSFHNK